MEKAKKQIKKNPMKGKKLFIILSIILLIMSTILIFNIYRVNILSMKYFLIVLIGLYLIDMVCLFILNKRFKLIIKIPFILISILIISGSIFGIYNIGKTTSFVQNIVSTGIKEEIYKVYVLNDSKYSSLNDLNGTKLGIYNNGSDTLNEALKLLKKGVTFKDEKEYDDIEKLLTDGFNKEVNALFISSSMEELINENYTDLFSKFKELDTITISVKETIKDSNVDVTKSPFAIYISGIDTYGSISTVSRSDVNIIAVVNPKTSQILLINTPRDYYVKLHSKKAYDKLTHAGIYGVDESLTTLEDLYSTDIDFYFKVNFSSLIKIVDNLGGITVNSKYSFSYDGYSFKKGTNKLDGKAALAFSRCRKELPGGDVSRGENQEEVIKAILNKVTSPSIIKNYTSILNTLSKSFVTNMDQKDIFSLAKYQISNTPSWNITSQNASGTDASRTTYSAGKTKLYVMLPDESSVTEVKRKINEIMGTN